MCIRHVYTYIHIHRYLYTLDEIHIKVENRNFKELGLAGQKVKYCQLKNIEYCLQMINKKASKERWPLDLSGKCCRN